MNRETRLIMRALGHLPLIDCFIISSSLEPKNSDQSRQLPILREVKSMLQTETHNLICEMRAKNETYDEMIKNVDELKTCQQTMYKQLTNI